MLRFFEGRDFAAVGAKLKVVDNTARMRVERALDKLRTLLERRGVKSTSGALAVALANQAVLAAPVGLAATVTGVALTSGAAVALGGGAVAGTAAGGVSTLTNFMSMTKLQLGLTSALAVAGATGFVVQADTASDLRAEADALRRETTSAAPLRAENLQLARLAVEVAELKRDDAELARLQEEASALRQRLQQLARAEEVRATAAAAANAAQVFEISRLDQMPRPKFQARPEYPAHLRTAGVAGQVLVDFVVDANGDVQQAAAVRSTLRDFEEAALAAVSKWKFAAGRKGGTEVATRMQVPIVFNLAGGPVPDLPEPKTDQKKDAAGGVQLAPFEVRTLP